MELIINSVLDNTYFLYIHYLFDDPHLLKIVLVVRYNINIKPKFSTIVNTYYEFIRCHCRQSQFYSQFIFHSYEPKLVCTTQISFILITPKRQKSSYHISQLTSILQNNYTHSCIIHYGSFLGCHTKYRHSNLSK